MQRTLIVLAICGSLGCRSGISTAGTIVGVGYGVAGSALVATADGDSDRRTAGIVSLAVASYILLMSVIVESRAGHDEPRSAGPPWSESWSGSSSSSEVSPPTTAGRRGGAAYDRTGAYAGRVDDQGNVYDHTGAMAGRSDPQGNYYDRTGASSGRVDSQGYVYDRTGASSGRVDTQGYLYDRTGASAGRIDADGSIYDRTGAYAGRVDGSCDEECRRTTAGRILLEP